MSGYHTRSTSISVSLPTSPQSPDLHHRPFHASMANQFPFTPLTQQTNSVFNGDARIVFATSLPPFQGPENDGPPSFLGMPLKYISLVTLAVQNAALTIIMHHSRVSTPPSRAYSAASAVLLNELLKGGISLAIAVSRTEKPHQQPMRKPSPYLPNISAALPPPPPSAYYSIVHWMYRFRQVGKEVFSDDCWKLAIPAILYVVQNNLQYVAAANLDVATFTVTYQMKILTTAAFSVMLLRKKLGSTKWLALLLLATGVGIVQLQAGAGSATHTISHDSHVAAMSQNSIIISLDNHEPIHTVHAMQPLKGFLAVTAACFTSGLAGVYFEMVLKGSKADLWIRNVQLSLFSLLPAIVPIIFSDHPAESAGWFWDLFRNFGIWAWATVAAQVIGGLVTAVVIKYSDNILKGFATSLSIIISFLASVVLFDFRITPAFVFGSTTVLLATFLYNQPGHGGTKSVSVTSPTNADIRVPFPGSPIGHDAPILGQIDGKKRYFLKNSTRSMMTLFGIGASSCNAPLANLRHFDTEHFIYGQAYCSRTPTPSPPTSSPSTSSPPTSSPPTRPPSASRPALGFLETHGLGMIGVQR